MATRDPITVSTASTTRAEARRSGQDGRGRNAGKWLTLAVSSGCAAVLLYLAVPRAVASFLDLPGNPAAQRLYKDGTISPEAAETLMSARQRSVLWTEAPQAWAETGFAQQSLAYARRDANGRPDRRMLEMAIESYRKALSASPADSTVWLGLAAARYALDGATPAAAKAYSMALLTGPVMIRQTVARVDLGFRLWPLLSPEDRRLISQVIYAGWHYASEGIVALANTPMRAGVVRATLASDPAALAAFEAMHAKRRNPGAG